MKKLVIIVGILCGALMPALVSAQVFSQNQLVLPPYGGFLVATSTSGGSKLQATTTPFFTSLFAGTISVNTLNLLNITGSTQCLHVNSAGLVSGTGSDCGTGSGGVTSVATTYPLKTTASTGAITLSTDLSTTTQNTWSAFNNFTYGIFVTLASSTNATTTNLAITGNAANCNGTSALTTNVSGVVGCTAQPQGTVTTISVATANGFAGSSSGGATPALTLTTSLTSPVVKANGTELVAATNGTDYTLITAKTCTAGDFVSSVTAAGVFTCTTPAGTTYTGTYPVIVTGSVISLAFGTTTSNTWGGTQTFTNSPVFSTLGAGTVNSLANGTIYSTATSSVSAGTGVSFGGTPGALIGGTNLTINNTGLISATCSGGTSCSGTNPILINSFSYPFPANATGTLLTFGGGLISIGSTTINGNATTTGTFFASIASSSQLFGAGLFSCTGTNALTWTGGVFGCAAQPQGTVTAISVATANGFAGSSSGGATPALTLSTTLTSPVVKANGTALVAATNGTDYSLITAKTCNAGDFVSSVTAVGVFTCTTPTGDGVGNWFTPSNFGVSPSNATSTLIGFTQGLYSLSSSTIGNGTQANGLTINGGATTTGSSQLIGRVSVNSTVSPNTSYGLSVTGGILNGSGLFSLAASGIVSANKGNFTFIDATGNLNYVTAGSGTQNNFTFSNSGNVGVGTTSPFGKLSINAGTNDVAGQPLFVVASSTATATSTLFSISNTGSIFTALSNGCVQIASGILTSVGSNCNSGSVYPFTPGVFGATAVSATGTAIQDTGGFFASSTVIFGNAGLPNFTFTGSNGHLGIGTLTPAELLQIVGTADQEVFDISNPGLSSQPAFGLSLPRGNSASTGKAFQITSTGDSFASELFYANASMGLGLGPGFATRDTFIGRFSTSTVGITSDGVSGSANLYVSGSAGIGSSTPWATLSVASPTYNYLSPMFAVATTTNAFGSLFTIFGTTTSQYIGSITTPNASGSRVSIGGDNPYGYGPGGTLDQLYINGRYNTGNWQLYDCPGYTYSDGLSFTSSASTACGVWFGGVDNTGSGSSDGVTAPVFMQLVAGTAANSGIGVFTFRGAPTNNGFRIASTSPSLETSVKITAAATSTYTIGLTETNSAGTTFETNAVGCYFTASSTQPNWRAVCTTGVTPTILETNIPSTTVGYVMFRIDTGKVGANRVADFYIKDPVGTLQYVGRIANSNVDSNGLGGSIYMSNPGASITASMKVNYARLWLYKDPNE